MELNYFEHAFYQSREYREDMGGVGSFNIDNRTLYVGRAAASEDLEDIIRRHFSAWGELEKGKYVFWLIYRYEGTAILFHDFLFDAVKVLRDRGVAFVTYMNRSNAEFAAEAMRNQSLDHSEILNVRYVLTLRNPIAYCHYCVIGMTP